MQFKKQIKFLKLTKSSGEMSATPLKTAKYLHIQINLETLLLLL